MRHQQPSAAKNVMPQLDDMLGILDRAKQHLPLESLVIGLKKIESPAEARSAARWVAQQIAEDRPEISSGLTSWWLEQLHTDHAVSPAEHAGELINALAIGRSVPTARTATHIALDAYLKHALHDPETAHKLLPSLPNLINQPDVLSDTRLRVFKCVQGQSAALLQAFPQTAEGYIQRLAEIAKINWSLAPISTPPRSPKTPRKLSSLEFITALAQHNITAASREASLELAQLEHTPDRLDYLDQLQLTIAETLKPKKQLVFLAGLHERIMFQPDLVTASRQGVIDAFNCVARSTPNQAQLAEKLQAALPHDGPLAAFLNSAAQRARTPQQEAVPSKPVPWFLRLYRKIRPPKPE